MITVLLIGVVLVAVIAGFLFIVYSLNRQVDELKQELKNDTALV